MEMVAIRYWFENILKDRVGVEEAQCRHVHRSFDNSSQTADTRETDHILDVRDQSNPPDGGRSGLSNMYRAEVTQKATAKVWVLDQTHIHGP